MASKSTMAKSKNREPLIGYIEHRSGGVLIEVTQSSNTLKTKRKGTKHGFNIEKFGSDDKLPDLVLETIWQSSSMPQLLKTDSEFLHGSGLCLFQKRLEPGTNGMPAKRILEEVEDAAAKNWFRQINLRKLWLEMCVQWPQSNNVYLLVTLSALGKPVKVKVVDWASIRAEERDEETGQIKNYIYFRERDGKNGTDKGIQIPRYYTGIEKVEPQFIYHIAMPTSGQATYAVPSWWGAIETIQVLNKIPQFHKSGLDNGYNTKYHVKIPSVWLDKFGEEGTQERKNAFANLQEKMDQHLSGTQNVDKAIITEFLIDPASGKPLPGVEIISLDNKSSDEKYLTLFKDFRIEVGGAVGINPALAGIDTGGKLSSSASELRTAAELHTAFKTPIPRSLLLEPLNLLMWMAGVNPDYFLAVQDTQLTTLDKNPTGKQTTVSTNAPAS